MKYIEKYLSLKFVLLTSFFNLFLKGNSYKILLNSKILSIDSIILSRLKKE